MNTETVYRIARFSKSGNVTSYGLFSTDRIYWERGKMQATWFHTKEAAVRQFEKSFPRYGTFGYTPFRVEVVECQDRI